MTGSIKLSEYVDVGDVDKIASIFFIVYIYNLYHKIWFMTLNNT